MAARAAEPPSALARRRDEFLGILLAAAGLTGIEVHGLHHGDRIERWERTAGTGIVAAQVAAVLAACDAARVPVTPAGS